MPPPGRAVAPVIAGISLLLPASAAAGTVTVTNDARQPTPLTAGSSLQIRQMAPVVSPAFSASEQRYTLVVTGPDGKSAGVDAVCVRTDAAGPTNVAYAGNGTYAVKFVTYENPDGCEGAATTQDLSFVIAASTTLTGPASPLLYRDPADSSKDLTVKFDVNPGLSSVQFVWAYNAKFGAGGAIVGDYPRDDYGERRLAIPNGTFSELRFEHAGTVSIVAAVEAGNGISPFSAPLTLKLIGPFDWSSTPSLTGGSGTTHVIGGEIREPGVVGQRVSVLLAKGSGKFKPFVSRTITSSRKLSFKIKKPRGKYRLKYVFKGANLVAAGAWTQRLTIGKGRSASVGSVVRAKS
jgi:hypothetical protein